MTSSFISAQPKRPLIMGIVNITPDSFSGDGVLRGDDCLAAALAQGRAMVKDGADILDIGGESTRPGAAPVSIEEEKRRVLPVLAALHQEMPDVPLSIDTMKPEVAEAALACGATILNDVSDLDQRPAMIELAARTRAYLVLMHNRARPEAADVSEIVGGEYAAPVYEDVVEEVAQTLKTRAEKAEKAGVARQQVILDPGIGFGKSLEANLRLIGRLDRLAALGYPVLLGASRKSFIGRVLDLPPDERLEGTAAAVAIGALRGAALLRVHDVRFMARLLKMVAAISQA